MKKGILLIGMPGCGKTTLGSELAKRINYEFIDIDEFIKEAKGKTIKEIFKDGEEIFRDIESESCEILSKLSNIVISSGGGIVKRSKNIGYFKDFLIVFIDRSIDDIMGDIDIETRPLLQAGKERLLNLYKERLFLYEKYSDIKVINNEGLEEVISRLECAVLNELNKK